VKPELLELLCSPGDLRPLQDNGDHLLAEDGRRFRVRDGIPCFIQGQLSWQPRLWQVFYDQTAFAYDATLHLADRAGIGSEMRIRREVLAGIKVEPGGLIVDIGCGTGGSREFFSAGINYLGIDISFSMLQRARAKFESQARSAFLVQADAEALPLRSLNADLILAMGLLQHVSSPELALREMARVAGRKSRLVLIDEKRSLDSILRKLRRSGHAQAPRDGIARLANWCTSNLNLKWADRQILGEYFILDLYNPG